MARGCAGFSIPHIIKAEWRHSMTGNVLLKARENKLFSHCLESADGK